MHRFVPPLVLSAALCGLPFLAPPARALPPRFSLQLVQSQLDFPTTIRFAPDGRLFYTEMTSGRIMVFPNGGRSTMYQDSGDGRFLAETTFVKELIPHIETVRQTDQQMIGIEVTPILPRRGPW